MKNEKGSIENPNSKYLNYLKLCLSSILFSYAFLNNNFAYISLIGLVVGIKIFLKSETIKSGAWLGYLFGFVFFLVQSSFVLTLSAYAQTWAYVGWVALSLLEAIMFSVFAIAIKVIHRKINNSFLQAIGFSFIYVALEIIRSSGVLAYQWGVSALPFAGLKYLSIIASLFGWPGVSFIIIFICSTIALMPKDKINSKIIVASFVLIVLLVLPANIMSYEKHSANVKVVVLQTNVDMKLKWENGAHNVKKKELENLIGEANRQKREQGKSGVGKSDIILAPESAMPGFYPGNIDIYLDLKLKSKAKNFIIGTLRNSENDVYNSVIGDDLIYDKNKLVPFGEFVTISIFAKLVEPLQVSLAAGKNSKLFNNIAILICSESQDSLYAREVVDKGAELIALSTNDAWFKGSSLSDQHLQANRFRAIENGRYLISAANYGYSSIIDPFGNVLKISELGKSQIIRGEVAFVREKTFYTKYGYYINLFIIFLALVLSMYVLSLKND